MATYMSEFDSPKISEMIKVLQETMDSTHGRNHFVLAYITGVISALEGDE